MFCLFIHLDEYGITFSGTYSSSAEVDLPERLCAEHIANLVNLKWQLAGNEVIGIASLRGISFSSTMLDLVTVAPIQFGKKIIIIFFFHKNIFYQFTYNYFADVKINDKVVSPQSETTVSIGTQVMIEIEISNNQASALNNLMLTVQFYQDYQNGVHNYRLETRVTMSGPN